MKLLRYRQAQYFEVKKELIKRMEFTDYQKEKLSDVLEDLPFKFVQFTRRPKSSIFMRLTLPLYLLFYLLLIIGAFVKWIFTGKSEYQHDGPVLSFLKAWQDRMSL